MDRRLVARDIDLPRDPFLHHAGKDDLYVVGADVLRSCLDLEASADRSAQRQFMPSMTGFLGQTRLAMVPPTMSAITAANAP